METYARRIAELVERERTFTRDASHELRSPLTVIKIATDLLLADGGCNGFTRRNLDRIRRATRDMESLLEAFLILARDTESGVPAEDLLVNTVLREEIERAQSLLLGKPVEVKFEERCLLLLHAPAKVVGLVLGNLVRNAFLYTAAGSVTLSVEADHVRIRDTGVGMDAGAHDHSFVALCQQQGGRGFGVGLSIVRRLTERFGWPVRMDSVPGHGTDVRVGFPQARALHC